MMIACNVKNNPSGKAQNETTPETDNEWLTMTGSGGMPHVVLVSGDEEYRSEEVLPQLAKIISEKILALYREAEHLF